MRFCLVGTGRCGTRLLRGMLDSHPDLFVFNETHWFAKLHECFGTAEAPLEAMLDVVARTRHVTGDPVTTLDADQFRARMHPPAMLTPAAFADLVGGYFAAAEGKSVWADKTPDYGYMAAALQDHWPQCRILHLIRDGAAVAQSMSRHPGYRALAALDQQYWCPLSLDYTPPPEGFPPAPIRAFAALWHRRIARIRNEATRLAPGSYLEVRHENVLADPAAVLDRLAGFLDLRPDPAWLAQAATLVDDTLAAKPRPEAVLAEFDPAHLALMRDLGYATSPGEGAQC